MTRHSAERGGSRSGFTLVEMLLVIAVLLVMAGLTYPSLDRLHREHKIRKGAESVRVRLTAARVHSLDVGVVYQFRYEPGGQRYVVLTAEQPTAETGGGPVESLWGAAGELMSPLKFDIVGQLSSGAQPIAPELLAGIAGAADLGSVSWSAPVYFYPDGSADEFSISVLDGRNQSVTVSVRGLTGAATVSRVKTERGT